MNLQLSLKTRWFEMTKSGVKTEDYREINEYWVKRFFHHKESKLTAEQIVRYILNYKHYGYVEVAGIFTYHDLYFKEFEQNVMTLGYPKKGDKERTLFLEHKGIEIRTGNPDWGAEPNKLYFVIKHGAILDEDILECGNPNPPCCPNLKFGILECTCCNWSEI